jgi:methylated-DNA-[protein]-cysteine S-methyltransferase
MVGGLAPPPPVLTSPGTTGCYDPAVRMEEPTILLTAGVPSPIGTIRVFALEGALVALAVGEDDDWAARALARRFGEYELREEEDPAGAVTALRRYLAGDLGAIDAVSVDPAGTPFQRRVWAALRKIPVGTTIAYSALAQKLGAPLAVRAVAAANGRNPIGIVIPCHRVIGADGSLVGYGGGLPRKRWLLAHEGALPLGRRKSVRQLPLLARPVVKL